MKETQTKIIGKITLDERFYEGVDRYSDGVIEDELLEIAKSHSKCDYRKVTEETLNWPVLYHFSPFRENIVEWIPLTKNDKVLEVGSGCGAITGVLSAKAGSVTGIDLSDKRSQINAHRLQDSDNVTIMVGNFRDIEESLPCDYDAIMLIGVFEYGFGYMDTENPYEDFLKILLKHLKKGGRLYIAIENRMGLKYFAGCTEDHAGKYFEGLEGYPGKGVAKTFTRKGLEKIFSACGVTEYSFYYPYPDYKFPHTIFSDEILPKKGELHDNIRNFDRPRMLLFDETKVFDTIIEDGEFPLFSNSYLAVIGPDIPKKMVKYSNDRDEKYGIVTAIEKDGDGFFVTKRCVLEDAKEHIDLIEKAYWALTEKYAGSGLAFNKCIRLAEDTLKFEFLSGVTLEELLDEALAKGDKEAFLALVERYKKYLEYNASEAVCDYDLIFQNIIVNEDKWSVIDYEWTVFETIAPEDLLKRAFWCYVQGNSARRCVLTWCGIEENFEKTIETEKSFQKKVQGNHPALSEIRHAIGNAAFSLDYMLSECGATFGPIQIYEDKGNGFSETESYKITEFKQLGKEISFTTGVSEGVKKLRIDPGNDPVIVILREAKFGEEDVLPLILKKELFSHDCNGKRIGADGFLFTTPDPHFALKLPAFSGDKKLTVSMRVEGISADAAARL